MIGVAAISAAAMKKWHEKTVTGRYSCHFFACSK